ncbi:hypothetical protein LSTR_LSTR013954 [Laodelphax striatellus]|uniref:Uncharacterized protein n=1 Tax=Laodelphax striatellus TaxID=195883 RepID=A0A482XRA0_LAOST|nr:hypothetical protein LSTR_LSTR013954 [Laodelphax striatellus]
MCANDILTHGAEPLFFLDYYACGELRVPLAATVIGGIAEGCRQAGCALIAGVHSNGYSMVRKVVAVGGCEYSDRAPFSSNGNTLGEELLAPTKMYVKPILPILRQNLTKALAHITGGGLTENIPRILNNSVRVELDASCWNMPAVFPWLCATGHISEPQMLRTFNCGIGMVVICSPQNTQSILDLIPEATVIGTVHARTSKDQPQVKVLNFKQVMEPLMQPYIKPVVTKLMSKKRVAVLISGNGSNLQALIDATKGSTIAEIVLVISNKDNVKGLERAKLANITSMVIDHKLHNSRESFEQQLDSALTCAGVDFVCLAGFMRVLTGYFVSRWRGRLINLHPSLLPAFKGADAIGDALAAGVRVTGCSVHFVEESVDAGVIISQAAVPIAINDTKETLAEKIHTAEHKIFPQALLDLAAGKIRLNQEGNRLVT